MPINIIQVYAPTADSEVDILQTFYFQIRKMLQYTQRHEVNIIMGNLNAKVGNIKTQGVTGCHGLGSRNERGDTLVQFCQEEQFVLSNTMFQLPKRRLYTWISPKDTKENIVRNQIDFILINKRFASFVKKASTYPGNMGES